MRKLSLLLILMQTCFACRTSHEFVLRDAKPVTSEEAPYINVLVKKKIAGLKGEVEANEGAVIRVNELGPSKSLLIDFDEIAFTKVVKSACDSEARDLVIKHQASTVAEVAWSGKYKATIESVGEQFVVSCEGL